MNIVNAQFLHELLIFRNEIVKSQRQIVRNKGLDSFNGQTRHIGSRAARNHGFQLGNIIRPGAEGNDPVIHLNIRI